MSRRVAVIGSGFSSLSAASFLAKEGFEVEVFEKNSIPGGRARRFQRSGFAFDMGPSWYWMPDVFEKFFSHFGKSVTDYYQLIRLNPSYRIYFAKNDSLDVPSDFISLSQLFESLEAGSSGQLVRFIEEAKFKYDLGINKLAHKPSLSLSEFADVDALKGVFRLHVFSSISSYIRKFFKEPRIIKMLEFPALFLGGTPQNIPALYSLMNYADMAMGTWYPKGGMYTVVEGMQQLAEELGVKFHFNAKVSSIEMNATRTKGLLVDDKLVESDYVIAGADYHHVEQQLLPARFRKYSNQYWDSRVLAPSSLIFFLGVNKRLNCLLHHTLFFDEDFSTHASEIYEKTSLAIGSSVLCIMPFEIRSHGRSPGLRKPNDSNSSIYRIKRHRRDS